MDPEAILAGLNDEQREAATATSGPVVILAGAGTGKTRVISHRVAYAAATDAIDPKQVLVVTFTEKAAAEMKHRLRALSLPQVAASTFHAAARRQLAYYWPLVHDRPLPDVLDSKLRIIVPLARALPGGYRFTPAKDLADEIEWAKVRRQTPSTYSPDREPPVPADVFTSLWRRYESAKQRADRIDFEDMLTLAVELYETDADALALVHRRYSWFSVDEYQDTNRLQEDLLRLWLGDRRDLCVVGDPDQTIYTFTGASSEYLTSFKDRYADARVVRLSANYRSTPQVIALANRLIPGRELRATAADGPIPELLPHADGDAEVAAVVARIRAMLADGVAVTEFAILVRTNAQLVPFEAALTAAEIPFTVRGVRFFERRDVRAARAALRDAGEGRLSHVVAAAWRTELGFDEGDPPGPASGAEARDRHAALSTLLGLARCAGGGAAGRHRRGLPGGPRPPRRGRGRCRRRRRHALDAPPRQGPRVGRRLPARSGGGHAADPPVRLRPGNARRGATPALRRHHPRPAAPRAVMGGIAASARRGRLARGRPGSSPSCVRTPSPVRRRSRRHRRPSSCPPRDEPLLERLIEWRRQRARADGVPAYVVADNKTLAAIAVAPAIGRRRRCWPCRASVSARSPATATRSWRSSGRRLFDGGGRRTCHGDRYIGR